MPQLNLELITKRKNQEMYDIIQEKMHGSPGVEDNTEQWAYLYFCENEKEIPNQWLS